MGYSFNQERRFYAVATAIVMFAFLLRLFRLGENELWLDEAASFYDITVPGWAAKLRGKNTPPLYYLLLHAWTIMAGRSETALRMLSVCFGTLFIIALIWAGRELFSPRAGLWSGAFAAVSPFHIYYSQEARAYTLLILALLLAYGTLWRALKTNHWLWWGLFSMFALLSVYTHYFALLGLIPSTFLLLLLPEKEHIKKMAVPYIVAASLTVVLFLPWFLWTFVFMPHSSAGIEWIGYFWKGTPPALAIPRSLELFAFGGQAGFVSVLTPRFGTLAFPASLRLLGLGILGLLGICVGIPWGDKELGIASLGRLKAWLWALLFFPLAALWSVSLLYKPVYVVGRYDIVAFPAYSLLLGLSFEKLQSLRKVGKLLSFLLACLLLVPIVGKLHLYYASSSEPLARRTAAVIDDLVRDGDVVVFTGLRGLPALYYLSRLGYQWREGYCVNKSTNRRFSCRMFPRETEQTPAISDLRRVLGSIEEVRNDLQDFVRGMPSRENSLWLVFQSESYSGGPLKVGRPDALLTQEIKRLGLKPVRVQTRLGLVQFR